MYYHMIIAVKERRGSYDSSHVMYCVGGQYKVAVGPRSVAYLRFLLGLRSVQINHHHVIGGIQDTGYDNAEFANKTIG